MILGKTNYLFSADIIRVLAIFGAVSIHIVQPFYGRWDFIGGKIWWITDIWNAFSRTSIPLFIILSGFLILSKEDTISKTWQRIKYRLLIPLIFWSATYHIWSHFYLGEAFYPLDIILSPFHGGLYHYYFLGILIGLYSLNPILRFFLNNAPKQLLKYFLILSLSSCSLLNIYLYLINSSFQVNIFIHWFVYLGYFFTGGLIAKFKPLFKQNSLLLLFVIYWIFTAFAGWINLNLIQYNTPIFYPKGALAHFFDYYISPNVMISSFSVFLLLINKKFPLLEANAFLSKSIKIISQNAFGIYLLHPFFIDFIHNQFLVRVTNLSLHLLLKTILVFSFSFIVSFIISKIPKLKIILGSY